MEELDLKELFKMFWNKKIQILCILIVFTALGIVYSTCIVTPMYSSSTTLVLASANSNSKIDDASITTTDLTVNSKLVSTYSELLKSKNVLRKVISNLHIDIDEATLRKNIKVSSVKDTELIQITVTDENKYNATRIANEMAEVFMDKIKSIYNIENVQVVDKAETSDKPSNVNYVKDITIFAIIGLFVSGIYVLIDNMLDTTIKSVEDIENVYQLPVLASVPIYGDSTQKKKKGGNK